MKHSVKSKPQVKAKSMSDGAVKKATGKTLRDWFHVLKENRADKLSHQEIALLLHEKYQAGNWWSQMLTVEFERSIGRREVGQSGTGDFRVSTSKTLPGHMDAALKTWLKLVGKKTAFDGVHFADKPGANKTEKWRYWRVALEDDSKVTAVISNKGPDKTNLTINHDKLPDAKALKRWKSFWKAYLLGLKT